MALQQNFLGVQLSRFDRSGVLLRLAILIIAALLFAVSAQAQVLGPGWWKAPGGGGSNPSVANNTNNAFISGGSGSGCNITVPPSTAGHAFAVGVVDFANSSPSYTVTDPQGDTCTLRANSGNGGVFGQVYEMWFICPDLAGGTTTVTITGSNSDATGVAIYELANVATSGTIYEGANGGADSGSNTITFALSGATSFSKRHSSDRLGNKREQHEPAQQPMDQSRGRVHLILSARVRDWHLHGHPHRDRRHKFVLC